MTLITQHRPSFTVQVCCTSNLSVTDPALQRKIETIFEIQKKERHVGIHDKRLDTSPSSVNFPTFDPNVTSINSNNSSAITTAVSSSDHNQIIKDVIFQKNRRPVIL